ncbi:MAG TPA: hypothetical protein VE994_02565 [Terriglobales bacterium]|nr:hypothetical protein [Terriglobales bacterium]
MKSQIMIHDEMPMLRRVTCTCALLALFLACFAMQARAQGAWKNVVVDPGGGADVGLNSNLVIDRSGNAHISYYDATHKVLWYAFRPAGDTKHWFRMPVETKNVGIYSSMAVDRHGHPHFTWISTSEDGLHYAFYDGKLWHKQLIDPAKIDYHNHIGLDANDNPRISYYQYHDPSGHVVLHLKYAYFDGKQWYIQTLDKRGGTGKFNSIAVDSTGNPHIAYAHVGLGDLLYAHYDGKEWQFSDADTRRNENGYVGMGNSIAVDSTGNPHVAYFDISNETVRYAYWNGSTWKTETVSELAGRSDADHVSLMLDRNNVPHIAFYDAGSGVLKYAVRKTAMPAATVKTVADKDKPADKPADAAAADKSADKAADKPADKPADATADKPADKPAWTEAEKEKAQKKTYEKDEANWTVQVVDKDGNVGQTPSLSFDPRGVPYISYYDVTSHELKLAYWDASAVPATATANNAEKK